MRRAMLATAISLVLQLGSGGVVSAQEASAEPTFAPESLAALLPDRVGGAVFKRFGIPPGELSRRIIEAFLLDPLPTLRKEALDLQVAFAWSEEGSFGILAIRVAGVAGERVVDAIIQAGLDRLGAAGATFPPGLSIAADEIAGTPVRIMGDEDGTSGLVFFAQGEVLFVVIGEGPPRDPDGPAALALAALHESIARVQSDTDGTSPRRFAFPDVGLALSVPGDWEPAPDDLKPDGTVGFFLSPDGFSETCGVTSHSFRGRVNFRFLEDLAQSEDSESATLERIETMVGDAVRQAWVDRRHDVEFFGDLGVTTVRYQFPHADTVYRLECTAIHEYDAMHDGDWLEIAETVELPDDPGIGFTTARAQAARDMLCSILVLEPVPERVATIHRSIHRSIPRTRLADVRREVRRFLRRHADALIGFRDPVTAIWVGGLGEAESGWFYGRPGPRSMKSMLRDLDRGAFDARGATLNVMFMMAAIHGAFDDPGLRADTRRVAQAVYRYGSTEVGKRPLRMWSWINARVDDHLRIAHDLEVCLA